MPSHAIPVRRSKSPSSTPKARPGGSLGGPSRVSSFERPLASFPIGAPGSAQEHAADREASRLSAGLDAAAGKPAEPARSPVAPDKRRPRELSDAHFPDPGRALPTDLRARLEPMLGMDLSTLRIHAQPESAELAASFGARAFALGNHLVFGARQLQLGSSEGRRLLAHELGHVAQQAEGGLMIQRSPFDVPIIRPTPTVDPRTSAAVEALKRYTPELANLYLLALRIYTREHPGVGLESLIEAIVPLVPTIEERPSFSATEVEAIVASFDEATIRDPDQAIAALQAGLAGPGPAPVAKASTPHEQKLNDVRLGSNVGFSVRGDLTKGKGSVVYDSKPGSTFDKASLSLAPGSGRAKLATDAKIGFETGATKWGFGVSAGFGKDLGLPFHRPTGVPNYEAERYVLRGHPRPAASAPTFDSASVAGSVDVEQRLTERTKLVIAGGYGTEGFSGRLSLVVNAPPESSKESHAFEVDKANAAKASRAAVDAVNEKVPVALDPSKTAKERADAAISMGTAGAAAVSANEAVGNAGKKPIVTITIDVSGATRPVPPTNVDPVTGAVAQKPVTHEQLAGRDDPRGELITLDSMPATLGKGKAKLTVTFVILLRF